MRIFLTSTFENAEGKVSTQTERMFPDETSEAEFLQVVLEELKLGNLVMLEGGD